MSNTNVHPIAPDTIRRASIALATANTNRDGTTGTYTDLLTAGLRGSVVPEVRVQHAGAISVASSPMICRLWHQVAGSGNKFMLDEILLAALTPTNAVLGVAGVFNRTNIGLGAGDKLQVTITIAEAIHFSASVGDY